MLFPHGNKRNKTSIMEPITTRIRKQLANFYRLSHFLKLRRGNKMNKAELIFVPLPEPGHLLSSIEFGKRLLHLDPRISMITILAMKVPYVPHAEDSMSSLTASEPRIRLINLPEIHDPPPARLLETSSEAFIYKFAEKNVPFVRKFVRDIVSSSSGRQDSVRVAGLLLDFFCVSMIDVGREVNLPSYIFLTSNLAFLSVINYLPERHRLISSEFDENSGDEELSIPGFANPVPAKVFPSGVFDKHSYEAFVMIGERFGGAKGILVNAFTELESNGVEYFSHGRNYPPVYPVGPILNLKGRPSMGLHPAQHEEIMKWLDEQPDSSVVFLCFGSMGVFGAPQIKEIAHGLELSGFRFLWSIRTPTNNSTYDLLPEGFMGRIMGRGMVCNWAPQVDVLAHKAIGGFVSHCGWNSIMESLWYGVPIATWPMYAEQQLNAFMMVRELGLAVEIRLDYVADGDKSSPEMVTAEEIARAVRSLMDGDSPLREKVKEMSSAARKAVTDGGSSSVATGAFIRDILGNDF